MSMDAQDGNIDGLEDLDPEEVADAEHPYGEVTAEDLSTEELVFDGVDAADLVADGSAPVDEVLRREDDPAVEETIEERLQQEEPERDA
ncbi:hypothetical protein [Tessaracoccus terricola]